MDPVPMSVFERSGSLWLPPSPTFQKLLATLQSPAAPASEPSVPPASIRMIGNRRMQCKDIPDEVFLDAVRRAGEHGSWRMSWNVETELATVVGPVPYNLFLAKARKLCDRKLLHGCPCGCRGDFHPPEECQGC